jgi:ROS/MUCR transcriptional regulator protein
VPSAATGSARVTSGRLASASSPVASGAKTEPLSAAGRRPGAVFPIRGGLDDLLSDPRRAITEDGIVCLVCGHVFRHLTNTHLRGHGLTSDEYKRRFGYNARRALMIAVVRDVHSGNALQSGLATRIRRQRLVEDPQLRREGGRHPHRLEELLTRRERQRRPPVPQLRDGRGRFVGGEGTSVGVSLAQPTSVGEHDFVDRLMLDEEARA